MASVSNQEIYKLPRKALIWMLAAHVVAFGPHIPRSPIWLLCITAICLLWRVMVHRGAWNFPGRWVRASLVVLSFIAVVTEYGTFLGVGPGVALLVLTFSLKLVEMHKLRDAYVILILSFFVIAAQFLFSQSLLTSLYQIFAMFVTTGALLSINQTADQVSSGRTAKLSMLLLMQSVPLMLALFVLFPRIGPLWALDLNNEQARSGLSERVTPGDIARLSQSTDLAFRAEFENDPPPRNQLYWRAMVMDHYNGRTWSQSPWTKRVQGLHAMGQLQPTWTQRWRSEGEAIRYSVIMEPTDQRWLFSLGVPMSGDAGVLEGYEYRLYRDKPVSQTFQYQATSYLYAPMDLQLTEELRRLNLQLPQDIDAETRFFAEQLYRESGRDPSRFADAINSWFATDKFEYTLEPPPLGRNSIDEFLFQTKQGFCAHYSSAFVFMMRVVGIPARMVTGYQGGEVNPMGKHVLVHQFDAHAWTEIWISGKGWVQYDPTAYIAPDRINMGLENALNNSEQVRGEKGAGFRLRALPLLRELRYSMDMLNYNWNRWVVGYDEDDQLDLMKKLFNDYSIYKMITLLFALMFTSLLIFAAITLGWFKRSGYDEIDRALMRVYKKLAKQGIHRRTGETPTALAQRISRRHPEMAVKVQRLGQLYSELKYAPEQDATPVLRRFKKACQAV